MKTVETLPCHCGNGVIEVEVTVFGTWKIEGAAAPCRSCKSTDFEAAREAAKKKQSESTP